MWSNSWRIPWQRCPGLRRSNPVRPADGPGPSGPASSSSATSRSLLHLTHPPSSCSNVTFIHGDARSFRTPPPRCPGPVLSSGSRRGPLSFASSFLLMVALRLPFRLFNRRWSSTQPRPYSFLLRCLPLQSQVLCAAHGVVRSDTSVIPVSRVPQSRPPRHRAVWLTVLPLTGPVIVVGLVTAGGSTPARVAVLSCLAGGAQPLLYQEEWPFSRV